MDEGRAADAAIQRFSTVASIVIHGAEAAIAYRCNRAYRRRVGETSPLAPQRAYVTTHGEKRASATEVTQFIAEVFDEIDRATRAKSGR